MNQGEIKSIIFLSNYFNHHQKPFSDAMCAKLGEGYRFIETELMDEERKNMGWEMETVPSYVVSNEIFHSHRQEYEKQINQADVVVIGSAPNELVKQRIRNNKLVFRYSERPLKRGLELWKYPYRFLRWHQRNPRKKNIYMLCASAYTTGDYAKFLLFQDRCYKWGYFPQTSRYSDVQTLIKEKQRNSLIWVARFIDLKHPEIAVEIGRRLKRDGYDFELNMIGNGQMLDEITQMVKHEGLEDVIHILGAMAPGEVRSHMEKAEVHLFTSDKQEGWGAVLNESMNSACVPVANRAIGSAPYLINDGENGYLYSDADELYEKVKYLLDHKEVRCRMAERAYLTIVEQWNAETAAERFLVLAERILNGEKKPAVFEKDVCSKAEII